jgi:hypothetical protein
MSTRLSKALKQRMQRERTSARFDVRGGRLVIVPNSDAWVPSKPLDSPGLYRQLGACDLGGPEELLRFIEYNGLLFRAKAPKEELANVIEYISGIDGAYGSPANGT